MKTGITRFMTVTALGLALSLGFVSTAKASEGDSPRVELKFIGNINEQPVFQLNVNAAEKDGFSIMIRDQFGNVLYSDYSSGTSVTKKFQINTEELGDAKLQVEVYSKKSKKSQVYEINRNTRVVAETSISKL
jgi:hypothetical protein